MDDFELDELLGESCDRGLDEEESLARQIAEVMAKGVMERFYNRDWPARRDAHPKSHGTVRATFQVRDDLDASLQRGLFQAGRKFDAWIRFSSGDPNYKKSDGDGDSHGIAIKLLGVAGKKLLPGEHTATTHDFLLIDSPTFIVDDPEHYLSLVKHQASGNDLGAIADLGILNAYKAFKIAHKKIPDLLGAEYFSTQAYRFGMPTDENRTAVKYRVTPVVKPKTKIPDRPGPTFLADQLRASVAAGDTDLEFYLQVPKNHIPPVETSTKEWKDDETDFHRVATIRIPKQVMTDERDAYGDNLSFTPWHALPAHRPLGQTNRVRRHVYQLISTLRHQLNKQQATRVEPDLNDGPIPK